MDRINILIENNKDFGDVAFLVDKPEFLEAIKRLRKKWRIKKLYSPDNFNNWKIKLFSKSEGKFEKQQKLREHFKKNYNNLLKSFVATRPTSSMPELELNETLNEQLERVIPEADFEADVRDLRIHFNKPDTFDKVIAYAIVCGAIPEGIYLPTHYGLEMDTPKPISLKDRTSRVAIYITPQSTDKSVLKTFRGAKRHLFTKDNVYKPFFSLYNKDEVSNIKRDRDWYWKNLGGESYRDVTISENKGRDYFKKASELSKRKNVGSLPDKVREEYRRYLNLVDDNTEAIRKAIKRYKQSLSAT